ncbi:ABC transporter substrate-binding protein [Aminobacterium mobile]|uniref:ABC transporter substrate-binding protein n=1 Tax=Aminobacterium mobile TaxID=81467 RepID=UPI0004667329|nr:ABC transporter substrate-binding protein [Aminobacterium mobile]
MKLRSLKAHGVCLSSFVFVIALFVFFMNVPLYAAAEVPIIHFAWDFDLHAGALLVATARGEAFKDSGVYLKPLVEKQQYELYSNGEKLALLEMVVTKGSSESAVLLGQKRIDCCVNSITGMMFARDQGTPVQILCPIHVDGIGLVFPPKTDFYGWDAVEKYIKESKTPVRLGYHSPASAPRVVLETALKRAGLKVTENPNDFDAEVLLVDLKGSRNLLPAFTGSQVDGWVGPSHYPETAEVQGIGKIVLNLKDFPPQGQWYDFPCCTLAAREDSIKAHPEIYQALTQLLHNSANWAMENRREAAKINADIIGIPQEAVEAATIVFTTTPTEKWMEGVKLYVDVLNDLGKFNGEMKGKDFNDIRNFFFDFSFINKVK